MRETELNMKNNNLRLRILSVGHYLPSHTRTNDWWPSSIVEKWAGQPRTERNEDRPRAAETELTEGNRKTIQAMANYQDDPFRGAKERRVMDESMHPSDMETAAAQTAIKMANVSNQKIDFILSHSVRPDFLNTPNACAVHAKLGLPKTCFSLSIDGMCNAFLLQLHLANQLIANGTHKYGLLVQSSNLTSMAPSDAPYSAWFGDGATAVVVAGDPNDGLLGECHLTDSSLNNALVFGVPGKQWHEEGRIFTYPENNDRAKRMLLSVADFGAEVVHGALAAANIPAESVDYYACHQAAPWMRELTREHIGLTHAQSVDTFTWAGSLSAANIPLALAIGSQEGTLKNGDIVAMYAGGSGITYSGIVQRWRT
ncbi:MAG: 3-oxoacyl-[acyl-carrier-protein] synthase III C-terminal domain-containing protein [Myxococcota bacterium]